MVYFCIDCQGNLNILLFATGRQKLSDNIEYRSLGMKLTYQYRLDDVESKPVEFSVLVRMVRDGELVAGDLVKAEWEREWHPAIELVGLFYMAGRKDAYKLWETEQAEIQRLEAEQARNEYENYDETDGTTIGIDDLNEMLETAETFLDLDHPSTNNEVKTLDAVEKEYQQELAFTARLKNRFKNTIAEAMGIASKRDEEKARLNFRQRISSFVGEDVLHKIFRWGTTLAAANLTVYAIISWSKTELQRFPDRQIIEQGGNIFPFWGWCSSNEYTLLLINTTLACGLLAYFGAMMLESLAED